jgi:tRNA(fMet)-specific endonuclease VapC
MILLDSDHLSILIDERDRRHASLVGRLRGADEAMAIPIVVIEEHLRGWLARLHRTTEARRLVPFYERLERFSRFLSDWEIASWTTSAADRYDSLRANRIRIGTKDLRIAALALENDALLLSANLHDFASVPKLRVEDWLVIGAK